MATPLPSIRPFFLFFLLLLCGLTGPAFAGKRGVFPPSTPPLYYAECSGCHIAYPPDLLPPASWEQIMRNLSTHFGSSAQMDEPPRKVIEDFLLLHSGRSLGVRKNGSDLRVTQTLWFNRMHGKLKRHFEDAIIGSGSNCAACHVHAESGRFDENIIPANADWNGIVIHENSSRHLQ